MNTPVKPIVSIIHGARRIGEHEPYTPSWPNELAQHLASRRLIAQPFFWDGSVQSGLSSSLAKSYADTLLGFVEQHPDRPLSIFGKSIGATIAEMALRHIADETKSSLDVQNLVRVGCPDLRAPAIPNVHQVFDVRSTGDQLFKATCLPLTVVNSVLMRKRLARSNTYKRFTLEGIPHGELNCDLTGSGLPMLSDTLFEMYEKLLSSA